jgi:hypothetical protein
MNECQYNSHIIIEENKVECRYDLTGTYIDKSFFSEDDSMRKEQEVARK